MRSAGKTIDLSQHSSTTSWTTNRARTVYHHRTHQWAQSPSWSSPPRICHQRAVAAVVLVVAIIRHRPARLRHQLTINPPTVCKTLKPTCPSQTVGASHHPIVAPPHCRDIKRLPSPTIFLGLSIRNYRHTIRIPARRDPKSRQSGTDLVNL